MHLKKDIKYLILGDLPYIAAHTGLKNNGEQNPFNSIGIIGWMKERYLLKKSELG